MPYKIMVQYPRKSGEKKTPSSFIGSQFESSFPLAYLSTQKKSIKFFFTKPKNSFKRPQNSIPTMAKKKERKREERGKRRSQKNSKEKIGSKIYELKSFKLHLPP